MVSKEFLQLRKQIIEKGVGVADEHPEKTAGQRIAK